MPRYVLMILLLVGCSTTDLLQTCGSDDRTPPPVDAGAEDGGMDDPEAGIQ